MFSGTVMRPQLMFRQTWTSARNVCKPQEARPKQHLAEVQQTDRIFR